MEKLLEKLTSYNLFNYLLPGIIFSILLEKTTSYSIIHDAIIIEAFLAFFIGLTISRIGSLVIGPILKKIKIIKFSEYKDFVVASKNDNKLEILSESNNMYRTFISLFFILIAVNGYEKFLQPKLAECTNHIVVGILFVLFICSYIKQTNFINKRIEIFKSKENK